MSRPTRVRSRPPRLVLIALVGVLVATLWRVPPQPAPENPLAAMPFGTHSHWLQPWNAYQPTPSSAVFVDGLGMNFNPTGQDPDLLMQMLARHGIRRVRIEIGWGLLSYNESAFDRAALFRAELAAAKRYGVRPLILLNSNHGLPCPTQFSQRSVTAASAAGANSLQLDDVSGLMPGYSGLSNLTETWAAEDLITAISGRTVTFSKPIPFAIPAGSRVTVATLKYRPFSAPGSADYEATLNGWLRYVDVVVAFVTEALSTTSASDKGFDLEIWNELTFGSNFLDINTYYATPQYQYDPQAIWSDLVRATARHLDTEASTVAGVHISDGFASTTPWQAASTEPTRISALSKHPYPRLLTFPADEQRGHGLEALNALGQVDTYVPTYTTRFPEYFATGIQTETMIRDMSPTNDSVAGVAHGRNARVINGQILPVDVWVTEMNVAPDEMNPSISIPDALQLKARAAARTAALFLHQGVTQLYFFAATGGDTNVGMVQDNFLAYARPGAQYPTSDAAYTSPALMVLQRMSSRLSDGLDRDLNNPRQVQVNSVTDTHNHFVFAGDGSEAHRPLYDREVLAVLPFQVNARKFVVPYYVMTRDLLERLLPEQFTVQLQGVHGTAAAVSVYDPINDTDVPVGVLARTPTTVTLQVTATDYPYLLTIQDGGIS